VATVYLDSSFISACVTDRTDPKSVARRDTSIEWWDTQRPRHDPVISQEVLQELSIEGFTRRTEALALVSDVPLLEIEDEVTGVAEVFVKGRLGLVPPQILTPDLLWEM
jgi:hypothetical protein